MNTQAASEWNIGIQRRRVTLLNALLLTAVVLGLCMLVVRFVALKTANDSGWVTALTPFFAGWLAVLIAWLCRGLRHRTRTLTLLLNVYIVGIVLFARGGVSGSGHVWLLLPPVLAFALLGSRATITSGIISILIYVFFNLAIRQKWIAPQVTQGLNAPETLIIEGGSFLITATTLTLILRSFSSSWSEVFAKERETVSHLEAQVRVIEGTIAQYQRQTSQLLATADITHAGSSILDPEALLSQSVNRIQEGFSQAGVYFVGLFLFNQAQQTAVLRAATGEAGQLLLDMGYSVSLDETSTIGRCIIHQEARIAQEVGVGTLRFDAVPMPHARSEIALPLRSRGRILGALNMASTQRDAFTEADIAILQTMADQMAVAIDNAVLYSQTRAALDQLRAIQQRYVSQAWQEFLGARPLAPVDYTQPGIEPEDDRFLKKARRAAMVHERTVATNSPPPGNNGVGAAPQSALVVPLKLRGQVIGTMALHETGHQRAWTSEEIGLAETVAEQVALTIENLRLVDETQHRAARQRTLSEVTSSVRETLDMETVLRTAVQEVRQALGLPEVRIRLATGEEHELQGLP